ncbi:MAG TPA: winged helix-turn-helix transcriptional regulator [Nitrososphaerales archaeon]|nr:winged helix-turn-helix transcriptional regulator [Nitrososphaerales archaeon]
MKLDDKDRRILAALFADGRASARQLARRTSLTAPTVSARLARMRASGLIRGFVPLLDPSSPDAGVVAFVTLRVAEADAGSFLTSLKGLGEVGGIFVTTGENNVTLKLNLQSVQELQPFIRRHISRKGVDVMGSQVVTEILKDAPPSPQLDRLSMKLVCEYCGGDVLSGRPYNISVGDVRYYFCCKTCRKEYLSEHGARLSRLGLSKAEG